MKKRILFLSIIVGVLVLFSGCVSQKIEMLKQEADELINAKDYKEAFALYEEIISLDNSNDENLAMYEKLESIVSINENIISHESSMDRYDEEIGGYDLNVYINDNKELFEHRTIAQVLYINDCMVLYNYTNDNLYKDMAIEEYYKYIVLLDVFSIEKLNRAEAFMNFTGSQIALGGLGKNYEELTGNDVNHGLPWVFNDEIISNYQGVDRNFQDCEYFAYKYFEKIDSMPQELDELYELSVEMYENVSSFYSYVFRPRGNTKYHVKTSSLLDSIYVDLTLKQQIVPNYEDCIEDLNYEPYWQK